MAKTKNTKSIKKPKVVNSKKNINNNVNLAYAFGINDYTNPLAAQVSKSDTIDYNLRYSFITNNRNILSQAYIEIGIIKKLVDIPVDDAFSGGLIIKSDQINEKEIEMIQEAIYENSEFTTVTQVFKWNRLFGGAGLLFYRNDELSIPLRLEDIKKGDEIFFKDLDVWEMFYNSENVDGGQIGGYDSEFFNYYGDEVSRKNLILLTGLRAPSLRRGQLRGWGYSIVEQVVRSINQYLKAVDLSFEVLDEFKLDIYKLKNLNSALINGNEQKVRDRIALTNRQKNYQNAVALDSEDDYQSKQISFTGLSEVMDGIRTQICADFGFPQIKLFGIPTAGLNASDESSLEIYNHLVESEVRSKSKTLLKKYISIKCMQLFGFVPNDLKIEFNKFKTLIPEQEENIKTQLFNRLLSAVQIGEISTKEFRDACNKASLLPINLEDGFEKEIKDKSLVEAE